MEKRAINAVAIPAHHTEEVWSQNYADYIPENGEFVVYDIDDKHNYIRIKIGDGGNIVENLLFMNQHLQDMYDILYNNIEKPAGSFLTKGENGQGPVWKEISRAEGEKF